MRIAGCPQLASDVCRFRPGGCGHHRRGHRRVVRVRAEARWNHRADGGGSVVGCPGGEGRAFSLAVSGGRKKGADRPRRQPASWTGPLAGDDTRQRDVVGLDGQAGAALFDERESDHNGIRAGFSEEAVVVSATVSQAVVLLVESN